MLKYVIATVPALKWKRKLMWEIFDWIYECSTWTITTFMYSALGTFDSKWSVPSFSHQHFWILHENCYILSDLIMVLWFTSLSSLLYSNYSIVYNRSQVIL